MMASFCSWLLFTLMFAQAAANIDYAKLVNKNIKAGVGIDNDKSSTALAYNAAGDNPLSVTSEDFNQMYEDNKDLWGDMPARDAHLNYQRSMTGNVDSARLLMEFSMVPSVKSGGSDLHKAAAEGDVDKVADLIDVTKGSALVDPLKGDGTTPLITAAMMGHARVVKLLLDEGADVEKTGINGATPLQIAASMGHVEVMQVLLEGGANADSPHKFAKSTALHFAAEMGQAEAVRVLCEHGANPEAKKIQGSTPLHAAADSNQSDVTEVLVTVCKADTDSLLLGDTTALYLAASKGYTAVVKVLLDAGSDSNFVMPEGDVGSSITLPAEGHKLPDKTDSEEDQAAAYFRTLHSKGSDPSQAGYEEGNGATALHAAVENGHIDVVKLMLKRGVKQIGSMEGATPLILAAMYNQHKIAKVLIKKGANLNDKVPKTGNTALYHAVGSGFHKFVDVLLEARADINAQNNGGVSALLYACGMGRTNIIEKLLVKGADPALADDNGYTCLHAAAERGALQVITTLYALRPRFDVNIEATDGKTALHVASEQYSAEIIKVLLRLGAEIEKTIESTNVTSLILAARAGRERVVEALLEHGANVNAKGNQRTYQSSAIILAAQGGHLGTVQVLLKHGAKLDDRLSLGVSVLYAAAERGHAKVVDYLIEQRATTNFRNIYGMTAVFAAAANKHVSVVRALLVAGARVDVQNKQGSTALQIAVEEGQTSVVEVLLEGGADWTKLNSDNKSAIMIAQKKRDFEMLKLLGKYESQGRPASKKTGGEHTDKVGGNDDEGEEEDEELPEVVMVSKVIHDGQQYLVDKRTGIVYSPNLDDPQQIGKWSEDGGVVLIDAQDQNEETKQEKAEL
eukprot:m.68456 g.68456  ORF g.68456 m.68456 type:complete len:855 (+) comp23955_c0_seq1:215-2779(+)